MKIELASKFLYRYQFQTILIVNLFYLVGILGLEIPGTHLFFMVLIPFALLLNAIVILLTHKFERGKEELTVLLLIFTLGYLVEIIGVNTHQIFGNYSYGNGLGIKFFGTPPLIGINWVMLVYCSASIAAYTGLPKVIQIFLASFLMILYDSVIEHVAPFLDMWKWEGNTIPVQNYLAWFTIAIGFQLLLKWTGVRTNNKVASAIFICQFIFFVVILIFLN